MIVRSHRPHWARWLAVVALAGVFALGPMGSGVTATHAAGSGISSTPVLAAAASALPLAHPPAAQPIGIPNGTQSVSSGPGTFYNATPLPNPSLANATCIAGSCYNVSNDVTLNTTRTGLLAVAYTSLTDRSPCATLRPYSVSNIAFLTSADGGQTWSPIQYLGNSQCSARGAGYPDAWEPSLTSLGNGTLVLVYVEYNLTAGALPPLTPYSWPPVESRLVLTESYDNGTAWTPTEVLNISNPASAPPGLQFTPAHPSVTAIGNTIYLTWMSLTTFDSAGSIGYLTSSTGGATWSPTIPISTGYGAFDSINPQIMVDPAGEVFIAYVSNISYNYFFCGDDGCNYYGNGVYTGNVWLAASTSNGTLFSYTEVAYQIALDSPAWAPAVNPTSFGPFQTPIPQLAYYAPNDTLYLAFTGGRIAGGSSNCFYSTDQCEVGGLYFYTSFDNGSSFTPGNIRTTVFDPDYVSPWTSAANATDSVTSLAMAVEPSGQVDLEAGFYNGNACVGTTCGAETEVVFSTSDNGTTFTIPANVVSNAYTPDAYGWNGATGAVAVEMGQPQFYWVSDSCPAWSATPCGPYPFSAGPVAQIEVSSLYTGAGTTLSFSTTALPSDVNWTISVMGNVRSGNGTTTLSVSGVPTGEPVFYSIPNVNLTAAHYITQVSITTPNSPVTLSGPTTVTARFLEYVPVTIGYTVPILTGAGCTFGESACPTFYPGCTANENFYVGCYSIYFTTGVPGGTTWTLLGHSISLGLATIPGYPSIYPCWTYPGYYTDCIDTIYNLTLLGWGGSGPGSVSTNAENFTFTPQGPVVETASFVITGACSAETEWYNGAQVYLYPYGCGNYSGPVTVDEAGLPAGVGWGVTFTNPSGLDSNNVSVAPNPIAFNDAPVGFLGVEPWNVPAVNPDQVWEAQSSAPSMVLVPLSFPIDVTYTLANLTSINVPVSVSTVGLPSHLYGNLSLEDLSTGGTNLSLSAPASGLTVNVPGGNYVVNASPVITTGGIRYTPVAIYAQVALLNDSNQSGLAPLSVLFGGPVSLKIDYAASYYVQVSAGPGGSASPTSQWVDKGSTVTLRATPSAGYSFLGWTGSGIGSTNAAQATLTQVVIAPGGPVTELATFVKQAAPVWTVHVVPAGLPVGQTYSMTLGNTTYTGSGTLTIRGLATGTYPVAFPDVTISGAAITRFVLSSVTATAGLSGSTLSVSANVTVLPVFLTQYYVTTAVVGSGSLSLGPGAYWETANTTLSITASPAKGFLLEQWVGSIDGGPSTSLGNLTTVQVALTGSVALVARFVAAPPTVPATFTYTLKESGLPSGAAWQFTLSGTSGGGGATASLTAAGLNGTYTLNVPYVYLTSGIRFVPSLVENASIPITSNISATVSFAEQVLVSVSTSGSGSASPGGWFAAGTAVPLTASGAAAGWSFAGWEGSGVGSYTGPNATETIDPTGPVTETATYVQNAPTTASGTSSISMNDYLAIILIVVVLAAIGILEGRALTRRRPPAKPAPSASPVVGEVVPETPALESPR
ncbi:MAG TPA: hypothetical protein VK424_03405 [Thermoplasmata archaeon]|nr:hypothetical protein [Thermoplasmata archaeon]